MNEITDLRDDCVARLDGALGLPPEQLGQQVDVVEREVARLRDALIQRLRRHELPDREPLDKVNAALSLIVGVEYPVAGLQRKSLEQARDTLREVQLEPAAH